MSTPPPKMRQIYPRQLRRERASLPDKDLRLTTTYGPLVLFCLGQILHHAAWHVMTVTVHHCHLCDSHPPYWRSLPVLYGSSGASPRTSRRISIMQRELFYCRRT